MPFVSVHDNFPLQIFHFRKEKFFSMMKLNFDGNVFHSLTCHFARNKTIFYSKVLLQLTEFLLVRWLVKTLIGYREVDNRTFSHFYVDIQLTQNDYLSRYVAEPLAIGWTNIRLDNFSKCFERDSSPIFSNRDVQWSKPGTRFQLIGNTKRLRSISFFERHPLGSHTTTRQWRYLLRRTI